MEYVRLIPVKPNLVRSTIIEILLVHPLFQIAGQITMTKTFLICNFCHPLRRFIIQTAPLFQSLFGVFCDLHITTSFFHNFDIGIYFFRFALKIPKLCLLTHSTTLHTLIKFNPISINMALVSNYFSFLRRFGYGVDKNTFWLFSLMS